MTKASLFENILNNHTFEGGLDEVGEPISCSGDVWGLLEGILLEAPENKEEMFIEGNKNLS